MEANVALGWRLHPTQAAVTRKTSTSDIWTAALDNRMLHTLPLTYFKGACSGAVGPP